MFRLALVTLALSACGPSAAEACLHQHSICSPPGTPSNCAGYDEYCRGNSAGGICEPACARCVTGAYTCAQLQGCWASDTCVQP